VNYKAAKEPYKVTPQQVAAAGRAERIRLSPARPERSNQPAPGDAARAWKEIRFQNRFWPHVI